MKPNPSETNHRCHDCGSVDVRIAAGYELVARVTSDCKPWPPGGILALCRACGLAQTVVNPQWQTESDRIYSGYTIYHQSGGMEQAVFDSASGVGQARSDAILNSLQSHVKIPAKGRWLDIGCGNGALLRACSRALPTWTLCGSEVNDKYRDAVESIPGVERLFTDPIENISGSFDVISLVHVLEHIPCPRAFLSVLANKLNPGGLLLLEVPDCRENFFMLVVADHCSHFSTGMLANVAAAAGYEVLQATNAWVPKEISVVARRSLVSVSAKPKSAPLQEADQVISGWGTLQQILAQVEPLTHRQEFGVFGTAIAATWLEAQTGHAVKFFVDEDRNRIGKQHLGKPILSVTEIPEGASVYIALPPVLARSVGERLRAAKPNIHFCSP
jgi:trans-aconitate methyltransferase